MAKATAPVRSARTRIRVIKPIRNINDEKEKSNQKQAHAAKILFKIFLCEDYGPHKGLTNRIDLFTPPDDHIKEELVTDELFGCFGGYCEDHSAT